LRNLAAGLLGCLLLLTAGTVASAQSGNPVTIRGVDFEGYPKVAVTASIKGGPDDIDLLENGVSVPGVDVDQLAAGVQRIEVVLIIDTSGSMADGGIGAAKVAARRFVNSVPPDIRVGVVAFADRPRVLQRPSLDHASALRAISSLAADGETALYDAVVTASSLFTDDAQRNLVLLSDGGDTVSNSSRPKAMAAVRESDAVAFTVGLQSEEFNVDVLKRFAKVSDGRYAAAGNADLSGVYEDLAVELSNQYVITYRTDQAAGSELTLTLTAGGVSDTFLTLVPRNATRPEVPLDPEPPAPAEVATPLIRDSWGMALMMVLVFAAVLLGLLAFFGFRYLDDRDRTLARLMGAVPVEEEALADMPRSRRSLRWIPEAFIRAARRITSSRVGFSGKLDQRLERGGFPISPEEFLAISFVSAIGGAFIAVLVFQNILLAILIALVAATIPHLVLAARVKRRFRRLHAQLADVVMILASSIRAGHSFLQALDMVTREIGEPGTEEFGRVVAEIRLGRSIDEAMTAMAERIGSEDFKWAVLAINIQREVGGNLAELLDLVADTLRERDDLRRQVDVLSAEGRMSVGILAALPVLIMMYMAWVNPDYIGLLFNTGLGLVLLTSAGVLWVAGFYWMRKIVKIDV
jgi:tight adherence protein B